MLKYFGLKEILYGLKRFAAIILAVTVCFAMIGGFTAFLTESNASDSNINDSKYLYSASKSYIISSQPTELSENQIASDRQCASIAASMLCTDFCKQHILNKLLDNYSKSDLIKYLDINIAEENITAASLNNIISSNLVGDTNILNFFTTCQNKDFSETLVSYFDEYFKNEIVNKISNLKNVEYLGGTTICKENSTSSTNNASNSSSPTKRGLIFAIIGFVLSAIGVVVYVFFRPSVAAKSDFSEYELNIIRDAHKNTPQDINFASDYIEIAMKKNPTEGYCFASTITSKKFQSKANIFAKKLIDNDNSVAFNITDNYCDFEKVKLYGNVVLLERKGLTGHTELKSTISLLKQYNINLLGVILI